jgi:hypothetical protein
MRGRHPKGSRSARDMEGSAVARERLEILLQAMTGSMTVADACAELGIGEAAYHKLRQRMLEGALAGLEPQTPGRRPLDADIDPRVEALEDEVRQLRIELRMSQVREEIALLMPHLVKAPEPGEKKTASPGPSGGGKKGTQGRSGGSAS